MAIVLVLGGCLAPVRQGVGPWDFDDHPGLTGSGPARFPDPARMSLASGTAATFPDGTRVQFVAISRTALGIPETQHTVNDRTWNPDGSPYFGEPLRMGNHPTRATTRENKGARYLTFQFSSSTVGSIEVYGYVPEHLSANPDVPEEHGRDRITSIRVHPQYGARYSTPIVIEVGKADRYRLGVAAGAWERIATIEQVPADNKSHELLKRDWGVVQMIGVPEPKPGQVEFHARLPFVAIEVVPREPIDQSFRLRLYDSAGTELGGGRVTANPSRMEVYAGQTQNVARIEVEARPMSFVEFRNVHFDPDPNLWGPAHWGKDGEKAEVEVLGIGRLEGLLRPATQAKAPFEAEFFAPDGVRWREARPPDQLQMPIPTGPESGKSWIRALLSLDKDLIASGRTVQIQVFASTSNLPGAGLQRPALSSPSRPYERSQASVAFELPGTPFVQFALRPSDAAWTRAGAVSPPDVSSVRYTPDDLAAIARGVNVGRRALTVFLRPEGRLEFFYPTPEDPNVIEKTAIRWNPDGETRLMVRLKDGTKKKIWNNGASSAGDVEFLFDLDRDGAPRLKAFQTDVLLRDVEAFEVETRTFAAPVYLVAKLPPIARKG